MTEATSNDAPWQPSLFPKQLEVFNVRKRFVLVSGPRLSGKTTSVLHRIIRHAWEVNGARVAMFSKTIKNAKGAGVWSELISQIIPEWIASGLTSEFGFEFGYTVEPKIDGSTRMHYLKLRNYWGGESEIQLHSLDYDGDVEAKLLETSYSLIYFSELQKFEDEAVFKISSAQLRMSHVPYEEHMWISDTNPPETGPEHFGYQMWFIIPHQKDHPDPEFQQKFDLFEFTVDDNLSAKAQQEIRDLKNQYRDDPEGWSRFIDGSWLHSAGHASKHFSSTFKRNIHIWGAPDEGTNVSDLTFIPSEDCIELIRGWDLGHVNHAMVILERTWNEEGQSVWWIMGELVSIAEKVHVDEFAEAACEKIEQIEKAFGKPLEWTDWSDTSAFRFERHGMDESDAAIVYRVSEGKINLVGAARAKIPGSVRKRVELIKKLLVQRRLFVAANCEYSIKMFEKLRKGDKELDFIVRGDENKHPFDALSYAIYSEMLNDLEEFEEDKQPQAIRRLISVPL